MQNPFKPPAGRALALLNTDARRSRRRSAAPRPQPATVPDLVWVWREKHWPPRWHLQLAMARFPLDVERDLSIVVRDDELTSPERVLAAADRQGLKKWRRLLGHLTPQQWIEWLTGSEGWRHLLCEVADGVWPATPSETMPKWRPRSAMRRLSVIAESVRK